MIHRKRHLRWLTHAPLLLLLPLAGWLTFPRAQAQEEGNREAREVRDLRDDSIADPPPFREGDAPRAGDGDIDPPPRPGEGDRHQPEARAQGRGDDAPRGGARDVPPEAERRYSPGVPAHDYVQPDGRGREEGGDSYPEAARRGDAPRGPVARTGELAKLHGALATARLKGRHEEAEQIERRIGELTRQKAPVRAPVVVPPGSPEQRIRHLNLAAENLEAAGMREEANRYREQAARIHREANPAPRGAAPPNQRTEKLEREVKELHEQVGAMRRQMEEMHRRMHEKFFPGRKP